MKLNRNHRSALRGEGLVVVIILLALLGGGAWWLYSHKAAMDKEGRAFGRQLIEGMAVKHDITFFRDSLGPQGRLDYPPSLQQDFLAKFQELGVPAQPVKIEENMVWESHFFEPKGYFSAKLNYPARSGTMQIAISHPVGKWQLDNLTLTWDPSR
ncbi:MAG: hypothetical protein QOI34_614 [Verrucomicrobiota bacterium]|jgi:hypothetical protein|nr:hypothetical protein [Spartobacteria bacterium]